MSGRITECRGIGQPAAKDCVETGEATTAAAPCTVTSDVCRLTTGDSEVKAKGARTEAVEEDTEECCCCEC